MKSAYLLAGMHLRIFLKLLRENNYSLYPRYVFRLLFVLQNAFWTSIFARFEKKKFEKQIQQHVEEKPPVIIIGHWRTGSTYLHQLMTLDENLAAPSLFQTAQPDSFKVSYRYYRPLMKIFLGKTRPFDQIKNGMDEPQEDEFALVRLTGFSPMLGLVFPKKDRFFLNGNSLFIPENQKKLDEWKQKTRFFYKKLSWFYKKQIILKNPFHSFRIKEILEMYPEAKFIHIYRNPIDVIPSTAKMWSIVGSQNSLNRFWKNPEIIDVVNIFRKLENTIEQTRKLIPEKSFTEIKFEEMEIDPVTTLQQAYSNLGLTFTQEFQHRILQFIDFNKNYKKNKYNLDEASQKLIEQSLEVYMKKRGYL